MSISFLGDHQPETEPETEPEIEPLLKWPPVHEMPRSHAWVNR